MADELQFIQAYKDIDRLIEYHQGMIETYEADILYNQKQMHQSEPHDIKGMSMDGQPHGNYSPLDLDDVYKNIHQDYSNIYLQEEAIKSLKAKKQHIESIAEEFEGLYLKVAVMKHIEGKSLQKIADELGYSLGYIQQISADIEKGADV